MSISSVNSIYVRILLFAYALYTNSFMCMYYNVLPNKLTHSIIYKPRSFSTASPRLLYSVLIVVKFRVHN